MKGYAARYLTDLKSFSAAFLVSMVCMLPVLVWIYGVFTPFVLLFMMIFGFVNVVVFAGATAVSRNYFFKLLVLLIAIVGSIVILREQLFFDSGTYGSTVPNVMPLLLGQVVFVFVLAYLFLKRSDIRNWLSRWGTEESDQ